MLRTETALGYEGAVLRSSRRVSEKSVEDVVSTLGDLQSGRRSGTAAGCLQRDVGIREGASLIGESGSRRVAEIGCLDLYLDVLGVGDDEVDVNAKITAGNGACEIVADALQLSTLP